MSLTEIQAKNSKPRDRAYKLADGEGPFLLVQPNGTKLWRMKYRFGGKEKLLSFRAYPALGLAAGRDKRTAAKVLFAEGKDPMRKRPKQIPRTGTPFSQWRNAGTRIASLRSTLRMLTVSGHDWKGTFSLPSGKNSYTRSPRRTSSI